MKDLNCGVAPAALEDWCMCLKLHQKEEEEAERKNVVLKDHLMEECATLFHQHFWQF